LYNQHKNKDIYKVSGAINIKIRDNYQLKATYLLEKMADDKGATNCIFGAADIGLINV
jgi:hypothetical protein